jgi:hypothetical protein
MGGRLRGWKPTWVAGQAGGLRQEVRGSYLMIAATASSRKGERRLARSGSTFNNHRQIMIKRSEYKRTNKKTMAKSLVVRA